MSVNSMYGFNPYMTSQSSGLNNDFMANATVPINNPYAQQAVLPGLALQQPTEDTFQKAEGGSGLNTGLQLAAVGGVGAGAGTYFFGDKLGAAITKDGKTFTDDILKAFETNLEEATNTKYATELARQEEQILQKYGFKNVEEFTKAYQNPKVSQKLAKDVLKVQQEINNINLTSIQEQALKGARSENLAYQIENLANLGKRKSLIEGLAKDATPAQIEELITKNPLVFGIEQTAEADIQAAAKRMAGKYKTQTGALSEVTSLVTRAEDSVKNIRKTLNGKVAPHWDDAAKAFKESAPGSLKNATKGFKWAKAGKYAVIAAGVGLVLGWMFGGKS